jgi:organic hydroperoxide reductase OsmC/OhrA
MCVRGASERDSVVHRTRDDTEALMRVAHEVCAYSNAARGNIDVKLVAE